LELVSSLVKTHLSTTLPLQETLIMPIGDIQHQPEPLADLDRLRRHVDWGMRHDAYFLGMGEYIDLASPSSRKALAGAKTYDVVQDALDEKARELTNDVLQILHPTRGRWLGLLAGHHLWEFQDGDTSDTYLARALGAPFLGDCAMIRCIFEGQGKKRCSFAIWCHHGAGGGFTLAAPLNKLERVVEYFDADVYLIGHLHKKVAAPMDRLYVNWNCDPPRVEHKTIIVACTGGFMKAYMEGSKRAGRSQGTYVEKKMLMPTALGGIILRARPVERRYQTRNSKESKHWRLDLNVEL